MTIGQHPRAVITVDDFGYLRTGNVLIDNKAKRHVDRLVEERFQNEMTAWAATNSGKLRTRLAIRFEIARELETLCAALGHWALVNSDEIFTPRAPRAPRPGEWK